MARLSTSPSSVNVENPFKASWASRVGVVAVVAYLFYSFSTLNLSFERLIIGFGEVNACYHACFHPISLVRICCLAV